jgi:hypothetical protein
VSDGGLNSYEEMPGAVIIDPPRRRRPTDQHRPAGQLIGVGAAAPAGVQVNQKARLVARFALFVLAAAVERN